MQHEQRKLNEEIRKQRRYKTIGDIIKWIRKYHDPYYRLELKKQKKGFGKAKKPKGVHRPLLS